MQTFVIVAMMSAALGPVLLAAGMRAGTLWSLFALALGLAWLAASGLYFTIFLQLGGDDATLVGALAGVLFLADLAVTMKRVWHEPSERTA